MVLSFMEEVISKFYKTKEYTVSHRVIFKAPDQKTVKEIDVLALNEKEAIIIGCRPYTGHMDWSEMIKSTVKEFELAEKSIKDIPMIKGKKIKKALVVEEPIDKVDADLKKKGIDIIILEDMMVELLIILLKNHKGRRMESRALDSVRNLVFAIIEEKL